MTEKEKNLLYGVVSLMLALTQTNDTEKIRDYFSKAIVTEIRQMRVAERAASVRAYTLQGTPATVSTRGIVIQNQIKIVRK